MGILKINRRQKLKWLNMDKNVINETWKKEIQFCGIVIYTNTLNTRHNLKECREDKLGFKSK